MVLKHYLSNPIPDVFIPYIFMEWFNIRANVDNNCKDLGSLVKMFMKAGYSPSYINVIGALDGKDYKNWPSIADVLWVHESSKEFL